MGEHANIHGRYDPPPWWNDPDPDSLFEKLDDRTNRCSLCGETVENTTEARDAHLTERQCHIAGKTDA